MKTLTITLVMVYISTISFAGIITVDNRTGSGANYVSIGSAIANASSGDTIYLHPSGTSYGDFSLSKQLVFIGPGHHPEFTNGMGASVETITLYNGCSGSKFIGMIIDYVTCNVWNVAHDIEISNNYFYYGVAIQGPSGDNSDGDNWLIQGNVIIEKPGWGGVKLININSGSSPNGNSNWIFRNNFIQTLENQGNNIFSYLNSTTIFENNIILHRNSNPIFFTNCTGGEFRNNIFWITNSSLTNIDSNAVNMSYLNNLTYHSNGTLDILPGTDNIDNSNPQFVFLNGNNPKWDLENNYQLSETSPGHNVGTDGTDLGIYGSNFPYRMEGYPLDFPRLQYYQVSNTVVPQGGTLEINLKAIRAGL